MAANSKIEWTDHTFNPWIGCAKVSHGCKHCYAELGAARFGKVVWGPQGTRVKTSESYWRQPLRWNKAAEKAGVRARVFCASWADVFEDWTSPIYNSKGEVCYCENGVWTFDRRGDSARRFATLDDLRRELFTLIDATPHLDWLLLTKRPENIRCMWRRDQIGPYLGIREAGVGVFERRNVWIGTSISNQADADTNIPHLLNCRDLSPVLFLSCEPLTSPVDLRRVYVGTSQININADEKVNWVIAGGESGHGARPMHPDWARLLRDQCKAACVPFLFKQWGEWSPNWAWAMARNIDPITGKIDNPNERMGPRGLFVQGNNSMFKVGKSKAGRLLDGVEHNEFPNVEASDGR